MPIHEGASTEFGAAMRAHLEQAEERNGAALDTVAEHLLGAVRDDHLVHVGGTGHSTAQLLETFYRAGGLACVRPLHHAGLSPLEGGMASTLLERTPGLAATILANAAPRAGDVGVVFSNSGTNPVPVELAEGLADAGCTVVSVCAMPHLRAASPRAHRKLDEVVHVVLDTGVPYGDAGYRADDGQETAALSSLTSVYLWDLLLARLADRAAGAGVALPLWQSANTPGGGERNQGIAARYRGRIPQV